MERYLPLREHFLKAFKAKGFVSQTRVSAQQHVSYVRVKKGVFVLNGQKMPRKCPVNAKNAEENANNSGKCRENSRGKFLPGENALFFGKLLTPATQKFPFFFIFSS